MLPAAADTLPSHPPPSNDKPLGKSPLTLTAGSSRARESDANRKPPVTLTAGSGKAREEGSEESVLLWVLPSKQVGGVIVVQGLKHAFTSDTVRSSEKCGGSGDAAESCMQQQGEQEQQQPQQVSDPQATQLRRVRAQMGVKLMWVHPSHRRKGLARRMLEIAR